MFVPVDLWTPVAELLGLRSDAPFVSGIWYLCTSVTARIGFALPAWGFLWTLWILSVWLLWRYVRVKQNRCLLAAYIVTGLLIAETPFALFMLGIMETTRVLVLRREFEDGIESTDEEPPEMPIRPSVLLTAASAGFVALAAVNVITCGIRGYALGYASNAAHSLQRAFHPHPIDSSRASSVVEAYVRGLVAETRDCDWLFSDGTHDDGYRIFANVAGWNGSLLPFAGASDDERQRIECRLERLNDRAALAESPSVLLKSWIETNDDRLKRTAVQQGISIWRGFRHQPVPGGFAVFHGEVKPIGIGLSRDIAQDILAFYEKGGRLEHLDLNLRQLFLSAQWRLARMAKARGEWYDRCGDVKRARAEMDFADRLNAANPEAQRAFRKFERTMMSAQCVRTPRESLKFALRTANFALAHRIAAKILLEHPEDVQANFAAGMDYLSSDRFALAEQHLSLVLKHKPDEPAVLNNLAIVYLKLGKLAESLKMATRAQKAAPNSSEVASTLKEVRRRIAERAGSR